MSGGPLLVVLTGPSGVGKDSLLALLKERGRPYHFTVTATTRPPRENERHGIDYFFVSEQEFERMRDEGELLEHAIVYDQHKGVPKVPIRQALAEGKDVIMRTDIQGARTIKSLVPASITIFVSAPSDRELQNRMVRRGGDSDEQVELRLRVAREEQASASEFDYVVVNEDLERCVSEIEQILERARSRSGRKAVQV